MAKEREIVIRFPQLEWASRNEKRLMRRYPGQWVAIVTRRGVVAHGKGEFKVTREAKARYPRGQVYVHYVPRPGEFKYLCV